MRYEPYSRPSAKWKAASSGGIRAAKVCWRPSKPFCWGLRRRKKTGMPAWKPSNSAYLKCRKPKITEEGVLGHQNTLNVPFSIFGRCELLSSNGTG